MSDNVGLDFEQYRGYVRGLARSRFFVAADQVDDVVQEVALAFLLHGHTLRNPQYIRTWLFATTRSKAFDGHRRAQKHAEKQGRFRDYLRAVDVPQHLDDGIQQGERAAALREAVQQLPRVLAESARNALADADVSGSTSTPRTRRHRLRFALRAILGDDPRVR